MHGQRHQAINPGILQRLILPPVTFSRGYAQVASRWIPFGDHFEEHLLSWRLHEVDEDLYRGYQSSSALPGEMSTMTQDTDRLILKPSTIESLSLVTVLSKPRNCWRLRRICLSGGTGKVSI